MPNSLRLRWISILILMILLLTAPMAAGAQGLPIDFTPGAKLLEAGYTGDSGYADDSIQVSITTGRAFRTDYWVARVTIAHPSQLRTASAGGFDSERTVSGKVLARRVNAALALNGDYYCFKPKGYLIRQGTAYRNLPFGNRDVLLIDDKGDFHIALKAGDGFEAAYKGLNIVNSFNFGPALVVDGQRVEKYRENGDAAHKPRQRIAIGQMKKGELSYVVVACGTADGRNQGMTLKEFSQVMADQGVETAYNLDGGNSTMLMFKGELVNGRYERHTRPISDIIYFASTQGMGKD